MTNHERNRRGLTNNPYCKLCPREVVDFNHIFRKCKRVRNVWLHVWVMMGVATTKNTSFMNWVVGNIRAKVVRGVKGVWNEKFAACLWWVWRWMNVGTF